MYAAIIEVRGALTSPGGETKGQVNVQRGVWCYLLFSKPHSGWERRVIKSVWRGNRHCVAACWEGWKSRLSELRVRLRFTYRMFFSKELVFHFCRAAGVSYAD